MAKDVVINGNPCSVPDESANFVPGQQAPVRAAESRPGSERLSAEGRLRRAREELRRAQAAEPQQPQQPERRLPSEVQRRLQENELFLVRALRLLNSVNAWTPRDSEFMGSVATQATYRQLTPRQVECVRRSLTGRYLDRVVLAVNSGEIEF